MVRHALPVLLVVALFCCAPPPKAVTPLDDVKDLGAVLNGDEGKLFVRPGLKDSVLHRLGTTDVGDGVYEAKLDGKSVRFVAETTATPVVYVPGSIEPLVVPRTVIAKIYINAECGATHPGFLSPCIGTFGPHRQFGQSMLWQVDTWQSCTRGEGMCVELLRPVGSIMYFPAANCADSVFIRKDILRFRCD